MGSSNSPYKVEPGPIDKSITVPTSKSYANRLLILAAIDKREVTVEDVPASTDVLTMLDCLEKVGLIIRRNGNDVTIENSFPECEHGIAPIVLKTGDGGTTNRFLASFLARGRRPYILEPSGHMRNRPMSDLVSSLKKLGARIESSNDEWMRIEGPFNFSGNKIENDCSKSTQFATSIALALADFDIEVVPINLTASNAYFEMTQELIENFKKLEVDYKVPVDFSSMGYPMAMGLTNGKVIITNCHGTDMFQADSALLKLAEDMGAVLKFSPMGLKIQSREDLKPIDVDGSKFPDLVPTLAYICSCVPGTSYLRNLEILRHKECDRVNETLRILDAFGVKYEFDKAKCDLQITGPTPKVNEIEFEPPEDHRMVMVTYLFMRKHGGGVVWNSHHVSKSFPDFFEIMGR